MTDITAMFKIYQKDVYDTDKLSVDTRHTMDLILPEELTVLSDKRVNARSGIGVDVSIVAFQAKIELVVTPSRQIREYPVAVALWDTYKHGEEIVFSLIALDTEGSVVLPKGLILGHVHVLPILLSGNYEKVSGAVH